MRRVAVLLVLLGLIVWIGLWLIEEGPPPTAEMLDAPEGPGQDAQPRLIGQGVETRLPEPTVVGGPGSIHGVVTAQQQGIVARVEVRMRRDAGGVGLASLLQPPCTGGEPLAATESDAEGRFEIPNLPFGRLEVTAHAPGAGWAQRSTSCYPQYPRSAVHLQLADSTSSLVGRAVHVDDTPFRGLVFATSTGRHNPLGSPSAYVETDPEGRFVLGALPEGEVTVSFLRPGAFLAEFAGVAVPQASEPVFVVDADLLPFEGRVIADDTEAPLPGARIEVAATNQKTGHTVLETLVAGPGGAFVLRLPAKVGRLWCLMDGFAPLQYPFNAGSDFVLQLKRRGIVDGIVVRKDSGAPLEGVAVYGLNMGTFGMLSPAYSNAEGRFRAEAGPGEGMVYALDRDWVSYDMTRVEDGKANVPRVAAGQGETVDVRIEVVPVASVDGIVRTSRGEPLENVSVTLQGVGRAAFFLAFEHTGLLAAVSDAEGRFEVRPVIPGHSFRLHAVGPTGLPVDSEGFTLGAGERRTIDLVVTDSRSLVIRLVDEETGDPVQGARIGGRQGSHGVRGTTDLDGRATLSPLLHQTLELQVGHAEYLVVGGSRPGAPGLRVPVSAFDEDEHVVELTRGYRVSGKVLSADGSPYCDGGHIGIHTVGEPFGAGAGLAGLQMLQKDAAFHLGPVLAGTYDVILMTGPPVPILNPRLIGRWSVEAGQHDLVLRIDPAAAEAVERESVTLRFLDPGGKPVHGSVRVVAADGSAVEQGGFAGGEYRVRRLRVNTPAWVNLQAATSPKGEPLGGLLRGPVVLKPGILEFTLDPPVMLEGRVLDPTGRGVPGLRVTAELALLASAPPQARGYDLPSTRTGADGGFALPNVTASEYLLVMETGSEFALVPPSVVRPGEPVEIRLLGGAGVEVQVRGPSGEPIAGASVEITLGGRDQGGREALTNAAGRARIEGLGADVAYEVVVKPPVAGLDLVDHRIEAWHPADLEVMLREGRPLDVRVRRGSSPAPHASVWWRVGEEPWRRERATGAGTQCIVVPVGEPVTLRAGGAQLERVTNAGPPVVVAPETDRVDLELH